MQGAEGSTSQQWDCYRGVPLRKVTEEGFALLWEIAGIAGTGFSLHSFCNDSCEAEQWNGKRRAVSKGWEYPDGSSVPDAHGVLCTFLQTNQTHLLELPVPRTYGAPRSPSPGTAPPTTVAALCSPTPWRSGTQWITNGQTSPPAAAPPSACRTCRLTASTSSACGLLTCTASASPARSLSW